MRLGLKVKPGVPVTSAGKGLDARMYIRDSGKFLRTPCSNPVFEWHVRVRQRLAMQMFKSVSLSVICMCVATDYQIDSSTSPVLSFALASGKDDAEHPVTEMESATAEPCMDTICVVGTFVFWARFDNVSGGNPDFIQCGCSCKDVDVCAAG